MVLGEPHETSMTAKMTSRFTVPEVIDSNEGLISPSWGLLFKGYGCDV